MAFLSTLPADPGARRLALVVVLVSAALFLLAVPFAKQPLLPLPRPGCTTSGMLAFLCL